LKAIPKPPFIFGGLRGLGKFLSVGPRFQKNPGFKSPPAGLRCGIRILPAKSERAFHMAQPEENPKRRMTFLPKRALAAPSSSGPGRIRPRAGRLKSEEKNH